MLGHKIFALKLSCKCGLFAAIFGGAGMVLGQWLFPMEIDTHHGPSLGLGLFSGMAFGMLLLCVPGCLYASGGMRNYTKRPGRILIHLFSWAFMIFGMVMAGWLLTGTLADFAEMGGKLFLSLGMITGMGIGAASGYFFSFRLIHFFKNRVFQ